MVCSPPTTILTTPFSFPSSCFGGGVPIKLFFVGLSMEPRNKANLECPTQGLLLSHDTMESQIHALSPTPTLSEQAAMSELKDQLHKYRDTIIQRDATINDNKNSYTLEIQGLQHQIDLLKQQMGSEKTEKENMLVYKENIEEKCQKMTLEAQELKRKIDTLTKDTDKQTDINQRLRATGQKIQQENDAQRSKIEESRKTLQNSQNQVFILKEKNKTLCLSLEELRLRLKDYDETKENLRKCQNELASTKDRNSYFKNVEEQLNGTKCALEEARLLNATLEGRLSEHENTVSKLNKDAAEDRHTTD